MSTFIRVILCVFIFVVVLTRNIGICLMCVCGGEGVHRMMINTQTCTEIC